MSNEVSSGWIEERLRRLKEHSDEILEEAPGVMNEFNSWSALKLILLSATVNMYTTILSNSNMDNYYYIDALAGSGISKARDEDEYFVGSPIIATMMAKHPFKKMYFIEQDPDKADALRQRLQYLENELSQEIGREEYELIEGDSNKEIPDIVKEIQKETVSKGEKANILSFVDNEGLDIAMETIKELTEIYGDFLINFPTVAVRRQAGAGHKDSMNTFYGGEEWRAANADSDDLRAIYMGKLAGLERPIQEYIPVHSGDLFYYDMIYCTRETSGGSPYIDTLQYMKEKIEPLTGEEVNKVLRFMRGDTTSLDLFPEEEEDEDENQMSLEQFK